MEKATRRGNYESGSDYVLEYGELRFAFNEQDFAQRVEQAAVKLNFIYARARARRAPRPRRACRQRRDPRVGSALGEHVNDNWGELVDGSNRSLVHWIRRLVFRGAWLDQRVKEGELDIVFDEDTQHLRLHPARSRLRADRALARALLGLARLPALARPTAHVRSASSASFSAASRGVEALELGAQLAGGLELVLLAQLRSSPVTRQEPATKRRVDAGGGELGIERERDVLGRAQRLVDAVGSRR